MSKDYKDTDTLKDIFKKGKEGLTNAKRELIEVIVKENCRKPIKSGKVSKKRPLKLLKFESRLWRKI